MKVKFDAVEAPSVPEGQEVAVGTYNTILKHDEDDTTSPRTVELDKELF